MNTIYTVSKKGGNNGALWNGSHPEKFFSEMHKAGVKRFIDVRRSPNSMYGSFFDTAIFKWCCEHDAFGFEHRLDLAPAPELFKQCDDEHWDLFQYAQAYFTSDIVKALNTIPLEGLDGTAILCAEQELYNCHRVLVAEFLKAKYKDVEIVHLGLAYNRYGMEKGAVPLEAMARTRQLIQSLL